MSRWYERIDRRAGRPPAISRPTADDAVVTFELGILGGELRDGQRFTPTPRTRLVIRCERSGEITLRICEGRSSGV